MKAGGECVFRSHGFVELLLVNVASWPRPEQAVSQFAGGQRGIERYFMIILHVVR